MGHIRVLAAIIFSINRKPVRAREIASKRVYVNVLFRQIGKITIILGQFKTEADMGFFWGNPDVIRGYTEPGLDDGIVLVQPAITTALTTSMTVIILMYANFMI